MQQHIIGYLYHPKHYHFKYKELIIVKKKVN